MASDWRVFEALFFSPPFRSCECFFLSYEDLLTCWSVSNVCRVMKWYQPREMTSPNDKQTGGGDSIELHLFNITEQEAMKRWHFE